MKRVEIELELPEDILLKLLLKAHDLDMTFNDFVNKTLREFVKQNENLLNKHKRSKDKISVKSPNLSK